MSVLMNDLLLQICKDRVQLEKVTRGRSAPVID